MIRIKKLPPHEAQKIAAGEVVDRPANIVKELLENALDAQAMSVTIYIENGGKDLIRVVDNGMGMGKEDALLCFEHHATSKIQTVDDLTSISSFGFRGEALSSISSVSNVSLLTKERDPQEGTHVTINQGKQSHCAVSCPPGTDISISDLFYNVPARKKFLKSKETETRHIQNLFQACCLDYPSVHFKLFSGKTLLYNCPPTTDISNRIAQLWDHKVAEHMLEVSITNSSKEITIKGVISDHHYVRYDRSALFFFVNNRWVKNYGLSKSLLKGYLKTIPAGRFPAAVISITVPPEDIDINIHPRKEEVKFARANTIETMLEQVVRTTLENNISSQLYKNTVPTPNLDKITFGDTTKTCTPPARPQFSSIENTYPYQAPSYGSPVSPNPKNIFQMSKAMAPAADPLEVDSFIGEQQKIEIAENTVHFNVIGQYKKTYILCEQEDGLYLIDQHAAHERILYEQFGTRFKSHATTKLMFPQIITISQEHIALIEPHLSLFHDHGIEIEIFGTDQLKILATPVYAKHISLKDIIDETIGWIHEYDQLEESEITRKLHENLRAQMACKAAVKAGDTLSLEQMQKLLSELSNTDNRFSCPHGRPTGWLLPIGDIEKKFKRDYRSY